MRVIAVVQGRMSSQRLPGKILRSIAGKPMIQYVIESVRMAQNVSEVVLATSDQASDDPVAEFAIEHGVPLVRGNLEDVAGRFLRVAEEYEAEVIVRISGDSPLIDHRVIDLGVEVFQASACPLVTNVRPRTYPPGCSVEVFSVSALQAVYPDMGVSEREHVTPALYHGKFKNFVHSADLSDSPLTVDTAEDFELMVQIIEAMDRAPMEYTVDETVDLRARVAA